MSQKQKDALRPEERGSNENRLGFNQSQVSNTKKEKIASSTKASTSAGDTTEGGYLSTPGEQNTKQAQETDDLLTNIALYINTNHAKQQELLGSVAQSFNQMEPQERDGVINGTAKAFSAFEKGLDIKAGAKWGAGVAGIGLIGVLGGCLAAAAVATKNGVHGGNLGANLKDVMSEVFPEALVVLAAVALLVVVGRTLSGAFSDAATQIASANDKRTVANAQDKITAALNDIKKNPLNVEAFKELENATKTLVEHASTQVLGEDGKTKQPILTPAQVQVYKATLQNISEVRQYAKLQAVASLLQNEKGSTQRDLPLLKRAKNIVLGEKDKNSETNKDYAGRRAQKLGIQMSSTSNTVAPAITNGVGQGKQRGNKVK